MARPMTPAERMAKWRKANPARYLDITRRHRARNREKLNEDSRRWRQENPERVKERSRAYREANRTTFILRNHVGAITDEVRKFAALRELGCTYCNSKERTEVDHKIPLSRGGERELSNLQWLCRKCNHAKFDMTEEEFFSHIRKVLDSLRHRHIQSKIA